MHNDHWWVYDFNFHSKELQVLDPLGHRRREHNKIDKVMVKNKEWCLVNNKSMNLVFVL